MDASQKQQLLASWNERPPDEAAANNAGQPARPAARPTRGDPLTEAFQRAKAIPSDCNQHVARLAELSAGRIVRAVLGKIDDGAIGLLAGRPLLLAVETPGEKIGRLLELAPDADVVVAVQADFATRHELLYIDGAHTFEAVRNQLDRCVVEQTQFVVLHDTESFGLTGEEGGAGILKAIGEWLEAHPDWFAAEHRSENNGLTILKRWDAETDDSRGLGDSLAKFTHHTGVASAVEGLAKLIGLKDCGCEGRQRRFNSWFPYWKPGA